jgi:hypothetical protein
LPHSDIHGSTPARGSPWLFAACHVLHRLLVPRHPPNALIALEIRSDGLPSDPGPTMHRNHPHSKLRMRTLQRTASLIHSAYTRRTHRHHERQIATTPLNVVAVGHLAARSRKIRLPVRHRGISRSFSRSANRFLHRRNRDSAPRDAPEPDLQFKEQCPERWGINDARRPALRWE